MHWYYRLLTFLSVFKHVELSIFALIHSVTFDSENFRIFEFSSYASHVVVINLRNYTARDLNLTKLS